MYNNNNLNWNKKFSRSSKVYKTDAHSKKNCSYQQIYTINAKYYIIFIWNDKLLRNNMLQQYGDIDFLHYRKTIAKCTSLR